MCVSLYIILPLFANFFSGRYSTSVFEQPPFDHWEPKVSVAFNVCKEIVNISAQSLFYTVQLKSGPFKTHFIRQLHEASIQTISKSHHNKLNEVVISDHVKNMIFIVEDIDELLSFIFDTIANENPSGSSHARMSRLENDERQLSGALPHYCVKINEHLLRSSEKRCDEQVNITTDDLKDGSILSDHVFNTTRGFHGHKVWNSKNYLVFMLESTDFEQNCDNQPRHEPRLPHYQWATKMADRHFRVDVAESLMLCFKLFWRFFKGQRTVICHPEGCQKYDPFLENLISNIGEAGGTFFDFSWSNMHGKPVRISEGIAFVNEPQNPGLGYSHDLEDELESAFLFHVIDIFTHSVNSTLDLGFSTLLEYHKSSCYSFEQGLKFDIDLQMVPTRINSDGVDNSQFDFSVSIDTGAVCIVVPHSGFISQGLVIFKCFSP
ncbi:unnamed protein product [Bemisia tabaci]|uniref:Uncharacterized protein n=1 Tax=Bemisia tabaci TaxID=7038 RepID=A0A9P0AJN3_BEMTA|nr:unnamed protein product [Bemisia tabaci]